MSTTILILLVLGALGHTILWVAIVNRLHAIDLDRRWMNVLTGLCGLALAVVPVLVGAGLFGSDGGGRVAAWCYLAACGAVAVAAMLHRFLALMHPERRGSILANHTSRSRVADPQGRPLTAAGIPTWLSRLPGNEVLSLAVHEKQLALPRLSRDCEGLRIVHLSDLHMSGRIARPYFEQVVAQVNAARPDVVAITGDIVERNHCLEWIPDTLGRLQAPGGVYYVLGNHDRKADVPRLKQSLADAGLIHLGGAPRLVTVCDMPVVLAGNELPWFGPAADLTRCPPHGANGLPLRIVLSHSPDQFAWARAHEVDLILAGHNHGGQVCLPLFGAILSPSAHGVRYAAGAFRRGNTVLHVSRGTASLTPIRWNCPPEIAVLVLRGAA